MASKTRSLDISPETDSAEALRDPLLALIRQAVEARASDIHLRANSVPRLRIDGELVKVKGLIPTEETMRAFFSRMLSPMELERFDRTLEFDFSYVIPTISRMRVNLYRERGLLSAAMRVIPEKIPTMERIGLPQACIELTQLSHGLVLVTGPTGSGKSTTLAAMINHINATRRCHILTIEDPIEYYFEESRALVSQRELDHDTRSFTAALRHSFRQDPDVVMLGEMRDPETMQIAITLAETGHLTFSTLHTSDAAQTVNRIIDAMPAHQRDQVRLQLSTSLMGVISQRLFPMKNGKGRVAAREIMLCSRAIRNLIREGKTNQILSTIQTSTEEGMITMTAALADLVQRGIIDMEVARRSVEDPKEFGAKLGARSAIG